MLNDLPVELLDNIINNINTTEDILNVRLLNKKSYDLLKEVPIYKYEQLQPLNSFCKHSATF